MGVLLVLWTHVLALGPLMLFTYGTLIVLFLLWLQGLILKNESDSIPVKFALLLFNLVILALGCFILFIIGKGILLILYTPIPGW